MASKPLPQLQASKSKRPIETASWASLNREQRLEAISTIFGIWKDHPKAPVDGLAYQEEMRSEW